MDDGRVPCVGNTDNGGQWERNRRGLLDMVMGSRERKHEQPKRPHYDSNIAMVWYGGSPATLAEETLLLEGEAKRTTEKGADSPSKC